VKKSTRHDWSSHRAAERPVERFSAHTEHRLALAYANSYHIGMSSLAFQRVYQLVHDQEGWRAERFFLDGEGVPLSVERDTPLGDFGAVAFSVSFEEDYVNLLRMLDRARIPLRRRDRGPWDPLVILGGACAAINPLPMAEFVDVFPLGAAENLLGTLLPALAAESDRDALLERLAGTPGYYVPARHRPEDLDGPNKLRKLELTADQMLLHGHLPTTSIVTPRTEFSEKFLIEMSRGCPEKCKYCWATFGMGQFRWHPTEHILASLDRARPVTDQLGFVATAVGDHPDIEKILLEANGLGFRTSVSSIRIPAVTEGVLWALHASGDRSITLAPETGTDELRRKLNKPVTNATLLEKVRLIYRQGFTHVKLYFLIGVPDETMDDVQGIVDLGAACRAIMLEELAPTGVIGRVTLGVNILVPKPYTPWQRQPLADPKELREKISLLKRGVSRLPNVTLTANMSIRSAVWQAYLSKGGIETADAIERAARGEPLSALLREFEDRIHPEVYNTLQGDLRWHFLRMN
jgi:radical SAM superfamily enzyme YgiQ (UPF0313 family)